MLALHRFRPLTEELVDIQRKMEGQAGGPNMNREMDDLRARMTDLEQVQGRVEELEERMDFSERVLTRDKETGQLKP